MPVKHFHKIANIALQSVSQPNKRSERRRVVPRLEVADSGAARPAARGEFSLGETGSSPQFPQASTEDLRVVAAWSRQSFAPSS
jgi:hypothetical protein